MTALLLFLVGRPAAAAPIANGLHEPDEVIDPARIPAAAYTWKPDGSSPVLDPSGARIAWIAGTDPKVEADVCIAPVTEPFACSPVGRAEGGSWLSWIGPEAVLVTTSTGWRTVGLSGELARGDIAEGQWVGGRRDGRLYVGTPEGNQLRLQSFAADGSDPRDEGSGRRDLGGWVRDGASPLPKGYFQIREDQGRWELRSNVGGRVRRVAANLKYPWYGQRWVGVAGELDQGGILMIDGINYDRDALVRVDLGTGDKTLLYEPDLGVVDHVLQDPTTGAPLAAGVRFERTRWHALAPELAEDLAWLQEHLDADYRVAQTSTDLRIWLLDTWSGTGPSYQLFDRSARTLTRAPPRWPGSEEAPWRPMEALAVKATDGLMIPGYLTTPDPERFGPGPYPLFVRVHGGPWAFGSQYGWGEMSQVLADLGWAVLAPDFRGSAGYGVAFFHASDGELGRAMNQDIYDMIDHVIVSGVADPARLAWFGESYGGYATLQAAVTDKTHITCGVSGDGPPRWLWSFGLGKDNTPANHPEDVGVPLLLLQGQRDGRVPTGGVRRFADRAVKAGAKLSMVEFPGEKHQYTDKASMVAFGLVEAFLGTCGGRPFEVLPEATVAQVPLVIRHDGAGVPGLPADR